MVIEFEQLNELQKQIVGGYSTGAYRPINHYLRNESEWDMFNIQEISKVIDLIFDIPALKPNPSIIFRGTQNDSIYNNQVFTDKAYMSTSLEENISHKFIPADNGILLKIHLQCRNINLLEIKGIINEQEYLIPRNTRFRILYRGEEINILKNQLVPCIGICPF
jgi:hypothetical protein